MTLELIGPELPGVARRALEALLAGVPGPRPGPPGTPAAGVFVTLRNPDGSLRGCIGSIQPLEADVVLETARSAVLAATRDPRFAPVSREELAGLSIEVSVLEPEEPVGDPSELDPSVFGVIVRDRRGRRGLLLPDIEGIREPAEQIAIARQKAGIGASEPVTLARFRVGKWKERR